MFVRDGVRSAGRFPVSSEGRERPLVRRRGGPTQDAVDVLEDLEVVVVGLVRLDVAVGQDIRHVERRDRIHPLVLDHQPPIDGQTRHPHVLEVAAALVFGAGEGQASAVGGAVLVVEFEDCADLALARPPVGGDVIEPRIAEGRARRGDPLGRTRGRVAVVLVVQPLLAHELVPVVDEAVVAASDEQRISPVLRHAALDDASSGHDPHRHSPGWDGTKTAPIITLINAAVKAIFSQIQPDWSVSVSLMTGAARGALLRATFNRANSRSRTAAAAA